MASDAVIQVYVVPRRHLTHGVRHYAEYVLRTVYHRDEPLVIGPYGKPEVPQNGEPLYCNGADSGRWVVCAFGDRPIGVDFQEVKKDPRIPDIARRMFDPDTEAQVLKTPSRRRAMVFSEAWAKREAVMKWSGRGFNLPMKSIVIAGSQVVGPEACEGLSLFPIPGFDANRYAAWICGAYKEKPRIDVIRD